MDLESERVLKLIFPEGLPENLQENPELNIYLAKLGTYKVEQLKKEQARLTDEHRNIVEQTQELAILNYKKFIQAYKCTRSVLTEFQLAEGQVEDIYQNLPKTTTACGEFLDKTTEINEHRRLNSITLKRNAQLLEILEIPQLMENCILESRYEDALELASYVQKMGENYGNIGVISSIVQSVDSLWHSMLVELVGQLKTDLQLPKCLQIVGYLRRMQAFSDNELKLKFLQARDIWFSEVLSAIPKDDAQQHLTKTIEVTRIHLFNIITQYRAIFPDDDKTTSASSINVIPLEGVTCNGGKLFQSWLHNKIDAFLKTLEADLLLGMNSYDTVLGQCMYFGLSFSRVGADFRALIAPIFIRVIQQNFSKAIAGTNERFDNEMERYSLIDKSFTGFHTRSSDSKGTGNEYESVTPPDTLLDFHPFANLCNGYLNALNELRLCAPIAIASDVTRSLQKSLEFVGQKIYSLYKMEIQRYNDRDLENFTKFCSCFAYDLIPYIQRCIHVIFPQQTLTSCLGINLLTLESEKITYMDEKKILNPINGLLPNKVDVMLMQEKSKFSSLVNAAIEGAAAENNKKNEISNES